MVDAARDSRAESRDDESKGVNARALGLLAIGTVLLILYLSGLDYAAILEAAGRFSVATAAIVVAVNLLPGALKYYRWRRFLRWRGLEPGNFRGYLAVNASFYLGLITPGTAGELSRAFVAESEQAGRATAAVVFEKLTDFAVLFLLVVGSAAVQLTTDTRSWLVVGAAGVLLAAGYLIFRRFDHLMTKPIKLVLSGVVSDRRRESMREAYWEFYELAGNLRLAFVSVVVSTALWGLTLAQMHLIFVGLGWSIPLKTTALVLFLPYLLGVVSFIPLGLGVFELTMSRVLESGAMATGTAASAVGPLFFRFLVTVPLVVGGYLCHLALLARGTVGSR